MDTHGHHPVSVRTAERHGVPHPRPVPVRARVLRDIDVSVIVPARDCGPWLDRCLTSLLVQRVAKEVLVVDDASTDGSASLLRLYAEHHPGVVRVVTMDRPVGAGRARNIALDRARGRYVFFCDADDYLGPEALPRMLAMADRNGSDIVLGKIVGHGRRAPTTMFHANADRVPLRDSAVYNSLCCFKLFRREMLEHHRIRFDEELRVGEDIVFTAHAYCHAEVISVVADYDCYHLIDRPDGSSVMQDPGSRDPVAWLRMIRRPMELMTRHVPPGPLRDHLLRRHFKLDALAQLGAPFLAADPARREQIAAEVGELCARWLTEGVRERLDEVNRQRLDALHDIDRLVRLARVEAASVRCALTGLWWDAEGRLVVRGTASLAGAGSDDGAWLDPAACAVSLVLRQKGDPVPARVYPAESGGTRFTVAFDPGELPSGVWHAYVAVACEGVTRQARLGAERDHEATAPVPRLCGGPAVLPFYTRSHGNLSLDVGGHVVAVRCAARLDAVRWRWGRRLVLDGRISLDGDGPPAPESVRAMVWRERRGGDERAAPVAARAGGAFRAVQPFGRFGPGIWDAYLELDLGGPPLRFRVEAAGVADDLPPPRAWWRGTRRWSVRPYPTAGKGRLSAVVRVTPVRGVHRVRGLARRLLRR
ncbi:glycosyltransferase family 2 protein [Thermocatellispora tengchongensis]